MSSKILTVGGYSASTFEIRNFVDASDLSDFSAEGSTIVGADRQVTGPYGDQITVTPVTLVGTDYFRMTPAGGVGSLPISGSALVSSVWVRLSSDTDGPKDVRPDLTTRNPVVSGSSKNLLMPGVWQRIQKVTNVSYTASTTFELGLKGGDVGQTAEVEVWMDSWMLEDYSAPFAGFHRTLPVSYSSRITVADLESPLLSVWGDSIVAGGGIASTGHYLGRALTGYFEQAHDSDTDGGKGGDDSSQVLTRFTAATDAVKSRGTIIWCGTNDSPTPSRNIPPEQTVENIISMVDQMIALGNTRYAVATVMHTIDDTPGTPGFGNRARINELLRAHPKLDGRLIDIAAEMGDTPEPQYFGDVTHPNNAGYEQVIFPLFRDRLIEMGYFDRLQDGVW